jgi:hypothetical protein
MPLHVIHCSEQSPDSAFVFAAPSACAVNGYPMPFALPGPQTEVATQPTPTNS